MQRISVVGASGSGKTTLARDLAQRMGVAHIELDALHWEPNWQEAPLNVFRARVTAAVAAEAWTADGNYSQVRDLVWARADTVVWLDLPLGVVLWRVTRRTLRRILWRQRLWNDNCETLSGQLSRDSIILWALRTYRRRRREYPLLLQQPQYRHLQVVHLRTPAAVRAWLGELGAVTCVSGK